MGSISDLQSADVPGPSHDDTVADVTGPSTSARRADTEIDERYELGSVLGRGGMGEVRLARDRRIDREVAVKLLRSPTVADDIRARFLREAKVQGRLDHPAVPPVHDLGIDRHGEPYFVMKRLAGTTLAEVLEQRSSAATVGAKWPRRQLLARLVDVCLAIDFAHAKGIVHRDLKPANIMLGDYGETYVLDWGLARIVDEAQDALPPASADVAAGQTVAGALLGTPGYMAPEQARGEAVDTRADVYALGCILYEIVTGVQPLPRGLAAIEATLEAAEHRPSKRVADVPPELDDLCARATAQQRERRPTTRELADSIQAYLDGDRDLERRRQLAIEHVELAKGALARPGDDARAEAMREASRAIVLDGTNTDAQDILAKLVLEAPAQIPAAALAEADHARAEARQKVLRWAAATYAGMIPVLALLYVLFTVQHVWPIALTQGMCGALAAVFYGLSRFPMPMRTPWFTAVLVVNMLLLICAAYIFGPLLLTPIFVVGTLAGMVMNPTTYSPPILIVTHILAFLVPLVLEVVGVGPQTFSVVDGVLQLRPYAVELTPTGAIIVFVLAMLAQFANTTMIGMSERRTQRESLDRVHAQSWHFKQLLPKRDAGGGRS